LLVRVSKVKNTTHTTWAVFYLANHDEENMEVRSRHADGNIDNYKDNIKDDQNVATILPVERIVLLVSESQELYDMSSKKNHTQLSVY